MNQNYPKQCCIAISMLFFYCQIQAQVINYKVTYNPSTSKYEVYGKATGTLSNINLGGSQLGVVMPASAPNTVFTVTNNVGGVWADEGQTFAPAAQPSSDFHAFATTGSTFSMTANTEVLFFSFSIGAACVTGARMYINGVDPVSTDPGMNGNDFTDVLVDGLSLNDYTGSPYNNSGTSCSTLPLTLLSFKGSKTIGGIQLEWSTSNETNTASFEVERSNNGISFSLVGNVLSKESVALRNNNYTFTDKMATGGNTYIYRLKMRDLNEQFSYSPSVFIKYDLTSGSLFHVYPNPVKGSYVYIQPEFNQHAAITVKIMNVTGSVWSNKLLTSDNLQNQRFQIPVGQLPSGSYILQILDEKGIRIQSMKFIRK
jgi:hypothetical protein